MHMKNKLRTVQYELMYGREAMKAIRSFPVAYLPIGCLERHGDHLPMGLDVIKAYKICCIAAEQLGGVVFPPHYYAGIQNQSEEQMAKYTGAWGNIYTDATARDSLIDTIAKIAVTGVKVLYWCCTRGIILGFRRICLKESTSGSRISNPSMSFLLLNVWSWMETMPASARPH